MATDFNEQRTLLGLEVCIPAKPGIQAEWHAGRLMARLADVEPTKENMRAGRRRLDKVVGSCKDIHMQLWPGSAVPLRPSILGQRRGTKDAWL